MKPARVIVDRDIKPANGNSRRELVVEIDLDERPVAREAFTDLMLEMLDSKEHSGQR